MKSGFLMLLSAIFMVGSYSAEACCSHHRNPGGPCEVWCTKGTMCAPSNCGFKEGDDSAATDWIGSELAPQEEQANESQKPTSAPVIIRADDETADRVVNQYQESTGNQCCMERGAHVCPCQ